MQAGWLFYDGLFLNNLEGYSSEGVQGVESCVVFFLFIFFLLCL